MKWGFYTVRKLRQLASMEILHGGGDVVGVDVNHMKLLIELRQLHDHARRKLFPTRASRATLTINTLLGLN